MLYCVVLILYVALLPAHVCRWGGVVPMADAGREPTRAQEPGRGTQGGAAAPPI